MSEPSDAGGVGCFVMSSWLIAGGLCMVFGLPVIIIGLVIATVVGGIAGVLNLMNMNNTGE